MGALSLWFVLISAHFELKARREKAICIPDPIAT